MKKDELYKIDVLAYNTKIGYITNLGTTLYEMQSCYSIGAKEYEEINNRLKLCCIEQNRTIDAAKGILTKPFPKHWTKYENLEDDMPEDEQERVILNRKLLIEDRPYFMRYLYPHYNNDYKNSLADFDKYCITKWGVPFNDLSEDIKETQEYKDLETYRNKKSGLLSTNGVMNKLCHYMEKELAGVKNTTKNCDNAKIFSSLYNFNIAFDEEKLKKIEALRQRYNEFKQNDMILNSKYMTYEQYYKDLRNEALETISSDIKELANLAVYLCYKVTPKKQKDFAWDCFGKGIYENMLDVHKTASVPTRNDNGDKYYLGQKYQTYEINLEDNDVIEDWFSNINEDFWENNIFSMVDDNDSFE